MTSPTLYHRSPTYGPIALAHCYAEVIETESLGLSDFRNRRAVIRAHNRFRDVEFACAALDTKSYCGDTPRSAAQALLDQINDSGLAGTFTDGEMDGLLHNNIYRGSAA